ncbi:MAG TPA: fumarylacetoacetate hydrolase family protein [Dehalococcoidia bacterium]|nr:fumarylacetoacetate hydrolase family protein [Dehalococcoidia bacterium]
MRIARYESGGKISYGIVEGDSVTPIEGDLFGSKRPNGPAAPLSSVRLLAPVVPRMILATALNYPSHLGNFTASPRPELFVKGLNTLSNPGDDVIVPADSGRVDYEGEMVAVIGKRAQKVSVAEALDYVFGYTCGNDVSCRPWQRADMQWFRGKSCDGHGPIGPWIATADEFDPTNMELRTILNGKEVQHCNTGEMINSLAEIISFASQTCVLEPGDIIFSGTSGQPLQINPGDVVDVTIDGLGTLSNPIVADPLPSTWQDLRQDTRQLAGSR